MKIEGTSHISDQKDLLKSIGDIGGLDISAGLNYSGDAEDYLYALRTYADSVGDKANKLEENLRDGKLEDYSLTVHSLKSMSKSIGANELHEMAKNLEAAGRSGDRETLDKDTPLFLELYRRLGTVLDERIPGDFE